MGKKPLPSIVALPVIVTVEILRLRNSDSMFSLSTWSVCFFWKYHSGAAMTATGASAELLSKVVFKHLSQAATWFDSVTSIPSLNFTPLMTLPR